MLKKSNSRTGAVAVWGRPLLFGTLAGALCTLLLLFAAAALCVATDVPAALVPLLAFCSCAIGAGCGGIVAGKIARKNGWLIGLLCGLCLWLLLSLIGFACVGGTVAAHALVCGAICLLLGAAGGIIGVNVRHNKFSV